MGALTVRTMPNEEQRGSAMRIVEVSSEGLPPVRLFFDPETGLLAKIGYSTRAQGVVYTEELFTDYRKVDGVSLPFKASIVRGDVTVMERALAEIKINPQFAPETFTRPAR